MALTIPPGLCYSTPQADYPVLASFLRAIFSGNELNFGSTTPAPSDRTKPWVRTNPDGTDDGVWVFYNGFWVQKHPLPTGLVTMWEGDPANVDAFDGGETAGVTNITGPFWELVTAMAARSPIHPGTLPSGTIINVGDDLGEEKHLQLATELATHHHVIKSFSSGATGGDGGDILNEPDPGNPHDHDTEDTGDSTPFNVIHPVHAILFIRRTARTMRRRIA
jgi:hypothetical protein